MLDVQELRSQFPILSQTVRGKELLYLDNAATTQKPQCVIDALERYYQTTNSNVHRGAHFLSDMATEQFEAARDTVKDFLGAAKREEIIWSRGTTESLNMVAHGLQSRINAEHNIVISTLEHHANIVPWQQVCLKTGAQLRVIPAFDNGQLDLEKGLALIDSNTQVVSITQVSNALGIPTPLKDFITKAKQVGTISVVDGAQGVAHGFANVQELGCDFYAFSGHKVFGPTGIGVLYGRFEILDTLDVWLTGGEMIEQVTFEKSTFTQLPYRLEAGTPNIAGAIGLGAALSWLKKQDEKKLLAHEYALMAAFKEQAKNISDFQHLGECENKIGANSFLLKGAHAHDIGALLDQQGIAIRTGHHCAMPLMQRFNVSGTARASFSIYNTFDEVERFFTALKKVQTFL